MGFLYWLGLRFLLRSGFSVAIETRASKLQKKNSLVKKGEKDRKNCGSTEYKE